MFPSARSLLAEPTIEGDLVYFGSWSGTVYAFDKKTGEVAWKTSGTMLDSGTLIAFDDKVYLPNLHNIFNCLDGQTGQLLTDGIPTMKRSANSGIPMRRPPSMAIAPSSPRAALSACSACRSSLQSIASIAKLQRFTGPIGTAADCYVHAIE